MIRRTCISNQLGLAASWSQGEKEDYGAGELIMTVFVEQHLSLPGITNKVQTQKVPAMNFMMQEKAQKNVQRQYSQDKNWCANMYWLYWKIVYTSVILEEQFSWYILKQAVTQDYGGVLQDKLKNLH